MIKNSVKILGLGAGLIGIIAGWYAGGFILPSLAVQNSERTNTVKTVRTVIKGSQQITITKTVQTTIHSHDDLPVHKHVATVEVALTETTPHGTFHNFPAAQTDTPNATAGGHGNAAPGHDAQSGQGAVTPAQNVSQGLQIIIPGREFSPPSLTVPVGAKVTWTNRDIEAHTITSDSGLFSALLNTNDSFSFTFTEPGTYNYHCENRPEMTGTVTVK